MISLFIYFVKGGLLKSQNVNFNIVILYLCNVLSISFIYLKEFFSFHCPILVSQITKQFEKVGALNVKISVYGSVV